ncbi:MAG: HD domain-containing protein [Treponema sp.]|nr:HD domain-containing protein [Treponema sp.]
MTALVVEQLVTFFSVVLSIACLFIVVMQPASKEQKLASTYVVFSLLTCLGYMGILLSNASEEMLVFSTKLKYCGGLSCFITFLLLLKYLKFPVSKWFLVPFFLCIAFFILIIFTFNYNIFCSRWLFSDYYAKIQSGVPFLHKTKAWGHTLFVLFTAGYSVGFTCVLAVSLKKNKAINKFDLVLLYVILAMPAFCYLFEKLFIKIIGYESLPVVPVGFSVSDLLFLYLILVRKFCDINILATPVVFDAVNVPAVVFDKDCKITNINSRALEEFPELDHSLIGQDARKKLFPDYSGIINELRIYGTLEHSERYFIYSVDKVFQPHVSKILHGKILYGYVLWLDDVTLLHEYKQQLEQEVNLKTRELKENVKRMRAMRDQMVLGFSSIAENHDLSSKGHLTRTAGYAQVIARELLEEGKFHGELDGAFVEYMEQVAPLHDIGKTYIDKNLLEKEENLNDEERRIVQQHTVLGAKFIETAMQNVDERYTRMAYNVALSHHEWWNGSGYPNGLKETEIPLCARIMAVADVYDALVTRRPYKEPFTSHQAFDMMRAQSGTQFDPQIIEALEHCKDQIEIIRRSYA